MNTKSLCMMFCDLNAYTVAANLLDKPKAIKKLVEGFYNIAFNEINYYKEGHLFSGVHTIINDGILAAFIPLKGDDINNEDTIKRCFCSAIRIRDRFKYWKENELAKETSFKRNWKTITHTLEIGIGITFEKQAFVSLLEGRKAGEEGSDWSHFSIICNEAYAAYFLTNYANTIPANIKLPSIMVSSKIFQTFKNLKNFVSLSNPVRCTPSGFVKVFFGQGISDLKNKNGYQNCNNPICGKDCVFKKISNER